MNSVTADSAQISVTLPSGTGGPTCFDGTAVPDPPNTTCTGIAGPTGNGGAGGTGGVGGAGGTGNGGVGGATTQPPRVEQFTLVNADTEMDMMQLTEASTLNLDVLPPNITARVDTDPAMVGSVVIQIDSTPPITENTPPYMITPDIAPGNHSPWTLALGSHTITATPYSGANATGTVGAPETVTFTLSRASALGAGGAPIVGGAGASGATAFGAGGFAVGAGGAPPVAVGAGGLATGGAFGAGGFGISGYAGTLDNLDGGSGSASCGCRLAERPGSSDRAYALLALGAGLGLRRRRRHASARRRL